MALADTDPAVLKTMVALAERVLGETDCGERVEASGERWEMLGSPDLVVLTSATRNAHYRASTPRSRRGTASAGALRIPSGQVALSAPCARRPSLWPWPATPASWPTPCRATIRLHNGGPVRHQPASAVKAVDTNGCGDLFHGAYYPCMVQGNDVATAIRIASAAAAIKATHASGRAGIPNRTSVDRFLHGQLPG